MAANPETSWQDAERTIFDLLCTATETLDGSTAYLGMLPPGIYNAWALDSGGGDGTQTWGGCFGSLVFNATITARHQNRADAQAFCMMVLNAMSDTKNFNKTGNVQWFRLASGGMPVVQMSTFTPSNSNGRELICYESTINCEMVFNTSTEY